jgi:hypothetical protein
MDKSDDFLAAPLLPKPAGVVHGIVTAIKKVPLCE